VAVSQKLVGAVVLAAGQSKRMGANKMTLPWQGTTVIAQVVEVLHASHVSPIVVVTGGYEVQVREALQMQPVVFASNADFARTEMATSLQCGLRVIPNEVDAILIALGDHPQIEAGIVRGIIQRYIDTGSTLVIPSYRMKRGHPWLVDRSLWGDLLELNQTQTMRDFLTTHGNEIDYFEVDTPSILKDLDTPADYAAAQIG
jgi:molybdenum cofactor cytidylyltransferase